MTPRPAGAPPSRPATIAVRTALFAAAWWVLTGGSTYGLPLALASIAAAAAASIALVPPGAWSVRPAAIFRFAPFFLWQSVRGGADVAWRAVRPGLPIHPGYLDFATRLPEGPARTCFAACLSLLPGTVSTRIDGALVRVHVLDTRQPVADTLRRLEDHVAAMFGTGAG